MKPGKSSELNVGDPVRVAGYGGVDSVQSAKVILRDDFARYWEYLLKKPV